MGADASGESEKLIADCRRGLVPRSGGELLWGRPSEITSIVIIWAASSLNEPFPAQAENRPRRALTGGPDTRRRMETSELPIAFRRPVCVRSRSGSFVRLNRA